MSCFWAFASCHKKLVYFRALLLASRRDLCMYSSRFTLFGSSSMYCMNGVCRVDLQGYPGRATSDLGRLRAHIHSHDAWAAAMRCPSRARPPWWWECMDKLLGRARERPVYGATCGCYPGITAVGLNLPTYVLRTYTSLYPD